jgi:hypothetical protein
VFQPLQGASVTVNGGVILGTNSGGFSANAPDNITLRGFAYTGIIKMWGNAKNILVDNVNGGGFLVQGATNVTVKNSDLGPCPSSGPGTCSRIFVLDASKAGEPPTTNVLFEGNTIHDFTITPGSGDHWECVFAAGGTNVTFRGNKFWNCETNAMAIGPGGCACGTYLNWVIDNNWFGRTCCFGTSNRNTAVNITSNILVLVRFNSFADGQTYVNEGGSSTPNVRVIGNILGSPGCTAGTVYQFNLIRGGTCGTSSLNIPALPYVNGSNQAAMDYHLIPNSPAERFVPLTSLDASLAVDKDGDPRAVPRDAGSDER